MWSAYNDWRTYEHALNATLQACHLLGAHTIVVSNVHSPCSKWFAQPPATMKLCVEGLRLRRGVSLPDAIADCHSGMRGSAGVDALNRKVRRTTSAFSGADTLRVRLVDSFNLTHGRCELVADDRAPVHDNGVHYVPLLYHELTLLFEALSWFRAAPPRYLPARPPWRLPIAKSAAHRIKDRDEAQARSRAHGPRATLVTSRTRILARRCYVARLDTVLGRQSTPAPSLAFGRELPQNVGVESRRSSSCSARAPRNERAGCAVDRVRS